MSTPTKPTTSDAHRAELARLRAAAIQAFNDHTQDVARDPLYRKVARQEDRANRAAARRTFGP